MTLRAVRMTVLRQKGLKSNAESGSDYSDILLIIPREKTGCVIEMKYAENGVFDTALCEAMEQIESYEYIEFLRQEGMETIHKYGLACYRRVCRGAYEKEWNTVIKPIRELHV